MPKTGFNFLLRLSYMNQVTDQLYVSDISTVRETSLQRFDTIVTTCQDDIEDHVPERTLYRHVNMADDEQSADTYGGSHEYSTFCKAADAIYKALERGDTVLAHCHAGRNRSVSTAAAALARHQDIYASEALRLIRDARPEASPNNRMLRYACKWAGP